MVSTKNLTTPSKRRCRANAACRAPPWQRLRWPCPSAQMPAPAEPDIRVEVRRANAVIVVKWPLQDGAACAAWLREWLK